MIIEDDAAATFSEEVGEFFDLGEDSISEFRSKTGGLLLVDYE